MQWFPVNQKAAQLTLVFHRAVALTNWLSGAGGNILECPVFPGFLLKK